MYHLYLLCRRIYLSDRCVYRYYEQGVFSVFFVRRWYTEKCYLHNNGEHRMYRLCSGVYV